MADANIIIKIWEPIRDYINNILSTFVPGGEIYEVWIISFIIAYALKTQNKWGNGALIACIIIIYSSLRYFGIGG